MLALARDLAEGVAKLPAKGLPAMSFKLFFAAAFLMMISACSPAVEADPIGAAITRFHETYNTGNATALYEQTGQEFRDATTPEQMQELVARVIERMGAVTGTERANINIEPGQPESVTVVTMTTTFEKGTGTETFTFFGSGADARLVGWNVDSPNFLTVPQEAVTEVEPAQ